MNPRGKLRDCVPKHHRGYSREDEKQNPDFDPHFGDVMAVVTSVLMLAFDPMKYRIEELGQPSPKVGGGGRGVTGGGHIGLERHRDIREHHASGEDWRRPGRGCRHSNLEPVQRQVGIDQRRDERQGHGGFGWLRDKSRLGLRS